MATWLLGELQVLCSPSLNRKIVVLLATISAAAAAIFTQKAIAQHKLLAEKGKGKGIESANGQQMNAIGRMRKASCYVIRRRQKSEVAV